MLLSYLVIGHVFGVPVALQPVFWSVLFHKITHTVAEVIGFEQEKLDDEVADLSLVPLVTPHRLHEHTQQSATACVWNCLFSVACRDSRALTLCVY